MPAPSYTVLGAEGFVGRRLASSLRAGGHAVYAPQRGDPALFARALGRVIYCAGLTADYARRPFDTVQAHVGLLARILQEADFEHLVYLSSTRLYDSLGEHGGVPVDEDTALLLNPHEARHLYDLSKALGENLCLHAAGGRAAVARLACVYDWAPGAPGFLSEWLQRAMREKDLHLDSSGGVVRDYIHLDDVVAALAAMAAQRSTGVVNVASGEQVSNAELAQVFRRHGWSVSLARDSARAHPAPCTVERLAQLGVAPRRVRAVIEHCLGGEAWRAAH
ncbi:NAD-dependent epimerase/dehydratase family protein [Massilia atriviolacea]|uniref:NAD-dependent epimerase/dehydratase family protein n=1 Tax=Massilia atriviolacea TaxID=2495579 RepID=UPI0013DEEAC2|nr:NAD-dependent epimerase/dehydratase family protein [Massilia atriviolacea]